MTAEDGHVDHIYVRHRGELIRLACRKGLERAEAEDLLHDTVIAALRAESRGQSISLGYFRVSMRREATRRAASARRFTALDEGLPTTRWAYSESSRERWVDARADFERLVRGRCRQVVEYWICGYSVDDTAVALNIDRETVRSHLKRARKLVREAAR